MARFRELRRYEDHAPPKPLHKTAFGPTEKPSAKPSSPGLDRPKLDAWLAVRLAGPEGAELVPHRVQDRLAQAGVCALAELRRRGVHEHRGLRQIIRRRIGPGCPWSRSR